MTQYTRMTIEEREKIYILQKRGESIRSIAKQLSRDKSTISRELKRGSTNELGYLPDRGERYYRNNLSRNKKKFDNKELQEYVVERIKQDRWSPEQVSGRMKVVKKPSTKLCVCTETIYKFIYSEEGQKHNLSSYLRYKRSKRGFRKSRKARGSSIPMLVSIHERPKEIEKRKVFGHWEGDLMICGITNPRNITTLIERKTRYTKLIANNNKTTKEVIGNMTKTINNLVANRECFKTITFDRGKEFTNHQELPGQTYFCDPASPWQKGSVENTNGRIRNIIPLKIMPRLFRQEHLDIVENLLNNTPRKVLGFKTPNEAFSSNICEMAF